MLVKSAELTLVGQQILMLGRPTGALIGDDTQRPTGALTNGKDDTQFPGRAVDSQSGRTFGKTPHDMQLSHRERQVLTCLAHGESNKEIARVWDISEATVKVHLKAILRKINMRNRTQAAIWAIEHGLRDSTLKANAEMPNHLGKKATDAPSLSPAESAEPRLADMPISDQIRSEANRD
jgi:DNA-binding CsgD family transcriptional regulator